MTTADDVANMAIALLEDAPISSLDEDVTVARLINTHYDVTREAELLKHTWVFAILSQSITGVDTGSGSGTLNYAYDVPEDCLRPLPLTYDGEPNGIPISWRYENGVILSDQEGPLKLRYIGNLIDPDDWDATFTDVLAAALAIKIALPLTHKAGMVELARNAYDRAIAAARRANAFQIGSTYYDAGWPSQRGDNRFWRA